MIRLGALGVFVLASFAAIERAGGQDIPPFVLKADKSPLPGDGCVLLLYAYNTGTRVIDGLAIDATIHDRTGAQVSVEKLLFQYIDPRTTVMAISPSGSPAHRPSSSARVESRDA